VIVCTVERISAWWPSLAGEGELIEVRIVADGFLPKMVRNISGVLIEIGRGKRSPDWMTELIAERDRRKAGMAAPAEGLTLWRVKYADDELAAGAPIGDERG
jgi:tRNA pseudouridine38-40 synthase